MIRRLLASTLMLVAALGVSSAWASDSTRTTPAMRAAADTVASTAPLPPLHAPPPMPIPLLLDRDDMGFGTTVVLSRIPNVADLRDLSYVGTVMHLVLVLPAWPASWNRLQSLQQVPLPEGADLIVVLPGFPPSREAAEAWNYLRLPMRIVVLVDGPPVDRGSISDLNALRGLERVVADMPQPSRAGFERLQRPLSFRVVKP